ncbi:inner-membrane translocator [Thermanaerovibrio acidaminovorans DSM 6589]|uniref:Inner-membrane translocator n=1 Tax=Thermanaerovibrio acidaminovorans (strain ATCC 49978 / DSM 6589 / Su883) TaxID=525903 RepID=D1B945_THEAS|nr:ABC transporter permease [Thermanaerovibrio acidaminovorans]ACZ18798.1 inner-membrane translocator [Thermanaerovibrio acidaminovorans DSM 6589]
MGRYLNGLLTAALALGIGAAAIALMGQSPVEAYVELLKGAFVGKFNLGGTLEKFVPLLLTALAFAVASKASVFNVGVEGELYLGAMAAAWVALSVKSVPAPIHLLLCFGAAILAGGLWAAIPGALKAHYGVNEVCVTILANYVAIFFTSYLVNYPLSSGLGAPQTTPVPDHLMLSRIMPPSMANSGLFIALAILVGTYWVVHKSTLGYRLRAVGENRHYAEHVGIDAKATMLWAMVASGAFGGIAGAIQVLGVFGCFVDNFSPGLAFDGMLASLIARNDIRLIPILSFFLAALKAGALGMERFTGVPKALVDTVIALFILLASMEGLFKFKMGSRPARRG